MQLHRFLGSPPNASMQVPASTLKYDNARKPLMALILTFSQWEKGLKGFLIFYINKSSYMVKIQL